MKISKPDLLLLHMGGINIFVQVVDDMVQANPGATFEQCARHLQAEIRQYAERRDALLDLPVSSALPDPLTLTLGELLKRDTCDWPLYIGVSRNVVYVVRDGDHVLYVGSTRYDARSRMKSHEKAHSPLGEALRSRNGKNDWTVEMIPHSDYDSAAIKEKELIRQFAPAFCRRT